MSHKTVIVSVLAIAVAFGVMVSGCNRDRNRTAMRTSGKSGQTRPAEVLSASAIRPPVRTAQPQPEFASAAPYQGQMAPIKVLPVYNPPAPAYYQQPVVVHPTPELAMARATLPQPQTQYYAAPAPTVRQARPAPGLAPIPELEPARYYRAPLARAPQPPSYGDVSMSTRPHQNERQEIQRALAPLPQPPALPYPQQNWVSSPATAMRAY